ncbi:MAG: hypothetical protein R3263_00465, partial [Myxococcota bacterium]|nr:hypothetical protein [Myxococcota bacterium]
QGNWSGDEYCARCGEAMDIFELLSLFFAANAAVAGGLAAAGALAAWTLWTGLLAYVAMALLFAVELLVRAFRFRRDFGLPTDRLFRRLFPRRAGR